LAQRHIELLVGRLVTDEAFRTAFLKDTDTELARLAASGYELTPVEIHALRNMRSELWSAIADQLDPRLQKASLSTR
jgi:hypothetical protein